MTKTLEQLLLWNLLGVITLLIEGAVVIFYLHSESHRKAELMGTIKRLEKETGLDALHSPTP